MKSHPYARFITWTAATYIEERQPGTGQSPAVLTWLRAYGITAARVEAFLRLSGQRSATMPNALVMDILELSNSKVRQTLKDEYLLDAQLHTWSSLADLYGRAATPADREVARLQLMLEAGHALIMAEGTGYPGEGTLLRRYWLETRWEVSSAGPPRKCYELTPAGQQSLKEKQRTWHELRMSMMRLLDIESA